MRRLSLLAAAAVLIGGGSSAWGQATTVQLPSFSFFTVQTTVSVPDRGGMALGGLTRGADGRVELGPYGNRATGSSRGASGMNATATILDSRELDATVLAAAAGGKSTELAAAKAAELARHVPRSASTSRSASNPLPGSVAAIREQNAATADQRNTDLAALFAKSQQAEASGKLDLAKAYLRSVARHATGDLKQQAEARLAALSAGKSAAVVKR